MPDWMPPTRVPTLVLLPELIPTVMVLCAFTAVLVGIWFARRIERRGRAALDRAAAQAHRTSLERDSWLPATATLRRDGVDHPLKAVRLVLLMPPDLGGEQPGDEVVITPPLPGIELTVIPFGDVRMLFEVGP